MSSILNSVKAVIPIAEADTSFDSVLIMHINSVFSSLRQFGPENSFSISNASDDWSSYLTDMTKLEIIKSYVGLKVKTLFDPPTTSVLVDSTNRILSELEWRINAEIDYDNEGG